MNISWSVHFQLGTARSNKPENYICFEYIFSKRHHKTWYYVVDCFIFPFECRNLVYVRVTGIDFNSVGRTQQWQITDYAEVSRTQNVNPTAVSVKTKFRSVIVKFYKMTGCQEMASSCKDNSPEKCPRARISRLIFVFENTRDKLQNQRLFRIVYFFHYF